MSGLSSTVSSPADVTIVPFPQVERASGSKHLRGGSWPESPCGGQSNRRRGWSAAAFPVWRSIRKPASNPRGSVVGHLSSRKAPRSRSNRHTTCNLKRPTDRLPSIARRLYGVRDKGRHKSTPMLMRELFLLVETIKFNTV
ncbi:hypothetical protein GWI33_011389 [Rhynchophorus ferrugineus]|uniref:Uncharacterized protein n=1 Tax=Rhynchophorus ferrugineus TaxID=354439 RepID=A0A834IS61_RHYFE|nr:hypothetical protein GWI33_011389 [Rhynchophorus ferrugineus]